MKLASLKAGGRDGALIVVSRDLSIAVAVPDIADTMQQALDDWERCESPLAQRYLALSAGALEGVIPFVPEDCSAPLPRAYQWLDGSAYVTHVELVRKARGATLPESFWTDPLMYQGASDRFIGPCDPIEAIDTSHGIDLEAEIAVVTGDVPMGCTADEASGHIKLLMLVNDVSARGLIPEELKKGFGFIHGKPATAFSPVAITPDELGDAWDGARLNLPLVSSINGTELGHPNAATDMTFGFPELITHAAKTRHLGAGTIIGSGTVANNAAQSQESDIGSSCLAERRMLETLWHGAPQTPFLKPGDRVRIEMLDSTGQSIFGAIDHAVVQYGSPSKPA